MAILEYSRPQGAGGGRIARPWWGVGVAGCTLFGLFLFSSKPNPPGVAKLTAAHIDTNTMALAINEFASDMKRLPTNEEGLNALVDRPNFDVRWEGPYVRELPQDPWKNPYHFAASPTSDSAFEIWSNGPDGISGTADDIRESTSTTTPARR